MFKFCCVADGTNKLLVTVKLPLTVWLPDTLTDPVICTLPSNLCPAVPAVNAIPALTVFSSIVLVANMFAAFTTISPLKFCWPMNVFDPVVATDPLNISNASTRVSNDDDAFKNEPLNIAMLELFKIDLTSKEAESVTKFEILVEKEAELVTKFEILVSKDADVVK